MADWYFDEDSTAGSPAGTLANPWTDPTVFDTGGAFNTSAANGDRLFIKTIRSSVTFNSSLTGIAVLPWPGEAVINCTRLRRISDIGTPVLGGIEVYSVNVGSLTIGMVLYDYERPIADNATPGKYSTRYPLADGDSEPGSIFGEEVSGLDATTDNLETLVATRGSWYQSGSSLFFNRPTGTTQTAGQLYAVDENTDIFVQLTALNGWTWGPLVIEGAWDANRSLSTSAIRNCTFQDVRVYLAGRQEFNGADAIALAALGVNDCTIQRFIVWGLCASDLGVGAFSADAGSANIGVKGCVFENGSIHRFDFNYTDGTQLQNATGISLGLHTGTNGTVDPNGLTYRRVSVHAYGEARGGGCICTSFYTTNQTPITRAEAAVKANHKVVCEECDFWDGVWSSINQNAYDGWHERCFIFSTSGQFGQSALLRWQNTTQTGGSFRVAFQSCVIIHANGDQGMVGGTNDFVFLARDCDFYLLNSTETVIAPLLARSTTATVPVHGITRCRFFVHRTGTNNSFIVLVGTFTANPSGAVRTADMSLEGFESGSNPSIWFHAVQPSGNLTLRWSYPTAAGYNTSVDSTDAAGFETAENAVTASGTWDTVGTGGDLTAANVGGLDSIEDVAPLVLAEASAPEGIVAPFIAGIGAGTNTGAYWGAFGEPVASTRHGGRLAMRRSRPLRARRP